MNERLVHVVDLDDGPDGGGGPAMLRVLRSRGVPFRAWAFETLSSGYAAAGDLAHVVPAEAGIALVDPADIVVAGSARALAFLEEKAHALPKGVEPPPWALTALLPRHLEALRSARHALPVAAVEWHQSAPARLALASSFKRGWILGASGRCRAVTDPEDAWLRLRRWLGGGEERTALVEGAGLRLAAFALTIRDARPAAYAALAVDVMHESWRIALGRTIDGDEWRTFAELVARHVAVDGLFHGLAIHSNQRGTPRFLTLRPGAPAWIEAAGPDGGCLLDTLLDDAFGPGVLAVPAGIAIAAVPVDAPLTADELFLRSRIHG